MGGLVGYSFVLGRNDKRGKRLGKWLGYLRSPVKTQEYIKLQNDTNNRNTERTVGEEGTNGNYDKTETEESEVMKRRRRKMEFDNKRIKLQTREETVRLSIDSKINTEHTTITDLVSCMFRSPFFVSYLFTYGGWCPHTETSEENPRELSINDGFCGGHVTGRPWS